ncbi:MAG: FAD binding domain-containing protein [Anaerolineae bacterium]|nr:FAD binding domain-containing protein [Anaerolineae bacterium]
MERFSYVRAESIPHAVALLNTPGVRSRPLAGGTDLLLLLRHERVCDRVVDISQLPELHRITRAGDTVTIGAAATFSEVIESPIVHETAPVLVQACRSVGATQIRNMGTLGGNVANAAACADSLPALVCLDAVARVLTPDADRTWPVSELVIRPNRTQIPPGGLLVSLSYRVPAPGSRGIFLKLGRRNAMAISRLTVAALGRIGPDGRIAEARLVPGSATPQIRRFAAVEQLLVGQTPDVELCEEAGRLAVAEMARITGKRWSSEYKEPALLALVTRALLFVFDLPWVGGWNPGTEGWSPEAAS